MKNISIFKLLMIITWVVSIVFIIMGFTIKQDANITKWLDSVASLLIEGGGAFFFATTIGYILDKFRDMEGYSHLWLFSQEFRKAGLLGFYSDRLNEAQIKLGEAFNKHTKGEVLLAGASLRLFLCQGYHFYDSVDQMLKREGSRPITVRALLCNPEKNHELPIRSFVEEFNQDKTWPKVPPYDWSKTIEFNLDEFENDFLKNYGIHASIQKCRVIHDLENVRVSVAILKGRAKKAGNKIDHREFSNAPYCTVIIFPDKAFYTPNLLSTEVPVNMPMMMFDHNSSIYNKLKDYFEFLWWVSGPRKNES